MVVLGVDVDDQIDGSVVVVVDQINGGVVVTIGWCC